MRTTIRTLALLLLLCCGLPGIAQAAEVRAWLDRPAVTAGDTVTLTIETGDGRSAQPDLTPLERDFAVLGTRTSTQVQIVNGRQSAQTRYVIELEPLRDGEITVPELRVGNARTPPLTLTVLPPAAAPPEGADLFVEVQAEPLNPYVQQQIRLTVRLLYAIPLTEGSLADPALAQAVVERLGEDVTYQTVRNGRRYNVVERRYAVFAEHSGELTLPPVRFQGRTASDGQPFSGFHLLHRGRRVRAASAPLTLTVRPRPAGAGAHWLPSPELNLHDALPQDQEFQVGEPITRRLVIEAQGLTAGQLPDLPVPDLADARVYADQPLAENRSDGPWLHGRRQRSLAIVPTAAGTLILPEIRLAWWDTDADRIREAVLPPRRITVLPAASKAATTNSGVESAALPQAVPATHASDIWPWIAAALLLLWLATLYGWWRTWRKSHRAGSISPPPPPRTHLRRALRQACQANDPHTAAAALLAWLRAEWPEPPAGLGDAARRWPAAADAILALDRRLYAAGGGDWDGKGLWGAARDGPPRQQSAKAKAQDLPPLYPAGG